MSKYCRIQIRGLKGCELLERKELDELRDHVESLEKISSVFFQAYGVDDSVVRMNKSILKAAMLDYAVDVKRLKGLHPIENINDDKIKAYECAWLLKRKPIQLLQDDSDYVYINEKFVAWLLMEHLVGDLENSDKYKSLEEFYQGALYHLIYRSTEPQTLEFMIVAFKSALEVFKDTDKV